MVGLRLVEALFRFCLGFDLAFGLVYFWFRVCSGFVQVLFRLTQYSAYHCIIKHNLQKIGLPNRQHILDSRSWFRHHMKESEGSFQFREFPSDAAPDSFLFVSIFCGSMCVFGCVWNPVSSLYIYTYFFLIVVCKCVWYTFIYVHF